MPEQQRVVIGELTKRLTDPTWVWHLPSGKRAEEFVPVVCGGGITMPGPTQKRPRSEVCPDCLAGRQTMAPVG